MRSVIKHVIKHVKSLDLNLVCPAFPVLCAVKPHCAWHGAWDMSGLWVLAALAVGVQHSFPMKRINTVQRNQRTRHLLAPRQLCVDAAAGSGPQCKQIHKDTEGVDAGTSRRVLLTQLGSRNRKSLPCRPLTISTASSRWSRPCPLSHYSCTCLPRWPCLGARPVHITPPAQHTVFQGRGHLHP
jgi:hypothetical protein